MRPGAGRGTPQGSASRGRLSLTQSGEEFPDGDQAENPPGQEEVRQAPRQVPEDPAQQEGQGRQQSVLRGTWCEHARAAAGAALRRGV